jgi:hypothetical protein
VFKVPHPAEKMEAEESVFVEAEGWGVKNVPFV